MAGDEVVFVEKGEEVVGAILRTTASDGTTRYIIRGDAEMQLAVMRIVNPQMSKEAAAVIDRACKLQDVADATGVDMEDDLFAATWGWFSRAVRAYQETRGSDAD